jgi:hypothetical protein
MPLPIRLSSTYPGVRSAAWLPLLLLACLAMAPAADAEETLPRGQWVALFNGRNLEGWTPKIRYCELGDNYKQTFRVEDGLLKVRYDGYDEFNERFGHLFYKQPFSHYRLRIEYRFVGDQVKGGPGWATRNSGVMLHGEMPQTMGKDQDFPASIEIQFLGGLGAGPRSTANLCTPGTHVVINEKLIKQHCTSSRSKTYDGDGWVTVEIEVHGNRVIRHKIDDQVVLEYNQPQLDEADAHARDLATKQGTVQLSGGSISLQSESHPIDFRSVEIMVLEE